NGNAMRCQYITYPFPKTQEAQAEQMGLEMLEAYYLSTLIIGNGNLLPTIYPSTIGSPDAQALYPQPLYPVPGYGDTDTPLNCVGNRFFIGLQVALADEWFELSRMVMAIGTNAWAPVRGSNVQYP